MNTTLSCIIVAYLISCIVSFAFLLVGELQCGNKYGWYNIIPYEEKKIYVKLILSAFIPVYNLMKSAHFAANPFSYIKH